MTTSLTQGANEEDKMLCFEFYFELSSREGETTVNKYQAAKPSADELNFHNKLKAKKISIQFTCRSLLINGAISIYKLGRASWLQHRHRWVFPSHLLLLAKPNRTFGLSSFSTWMCCMSWCVKKGIDYLDQKMIRCQFLCRLSFLIKERRVADRAKPELINIKQPSRAQTSKKTKLNSKHPLLAFRFKSKRNCNVEFSTVITKPSPTVDEKTGVKFSQAKLTF